MIRFLGFALLLMILPAAGCATFSERYSSEQVSGAAPVLFNSRGFCIERVSVDGSANAQTMHLTVSLSDAFYTLNDGEIDLRRVGPSPGVSPATAPAPPAGSK